MNKSQIEDILIVDIETVKGHKDYATFAEKEPEKADLFLKRFRNYIGKDNVTAESQYNDKAPLFAEFGKMISFSICWLKHEEGEWKKNKAAFFETDEKVLLNKFTNILKGFAAKHNNKVIIGGFNQSNFDIPFISKRYLYNGMKLPSQINYYGKKPWDIEKVDVAEYMRFGQFQDSYMSLELVCHMFGLDNPKTILGAENVGLLYYDESVPLPEKGKRINEYCQADTIAVADLIIKLFDTE